MTRPITLCGSLSRFPSGLGAAMHNAGYAALSLPYTYVPFGCEDLGGALTGMRALGIRGLGVSMPFKLQIIPLLDGLEPLAARIGAVNTVVNDGGHLRGHNTDWSGASRALEEELSLAGRRVLVLGAGGAARAVAFGLVDRGARVVVCNRTDAHAVSLAAAVGAEPRPWSARVDLDDVDAVVNATSCGQADVTTTSPLPEAALRPALVVMDIVYKPVETELVAAARRRGAIAISGGRMLLHQAARQFELYTGEPAPLDAMDRALRACLGQDPAT